MTMVNLAGIRSTVRLRGDYPVSAKFGDAYVNGEIQPAFSELYELIADVYEGWWDTKTTLPTVIGQDFVSLPATCWRVRGLDVQDGQFWRELRQVNIGERNRWPDATGSLVAYRLTARGADLFRIPDAVYTLRLTYTPTVTPLDETATINLYNDWQEYVVESALLRLHKRQERSITETWTKLFDPENGIKARIVKAASLRRAQEPEYLELREHGHLFGDGWWL